MAKIWPRTVVNIHRKASCAIYSDNDVSQLIYGIKWRVSDTQGLGSSCWRVFTSNDRTCLTDELLLQRLSGGRGRCRAVPVDEPVRWRITPSRRAMSLHETELETAAAAAAARRRRRRPRDGKHDDIMRSGDGRTDRRRETTTDSRSRSPAHVDGADCFETVQLAVIG